MRISLSFALALLVSASAFAAEEKAMTAPPVMLGQVVLGLLFVVGLILLLAWILKKLGHGGGGYSRSMQVVATMPLGTREKAVLVQVGDRQLLLGVAPGRVSCLHVFDEPVVTLDESSGGSGADFASRFKEVLSQRMGR